VIEYETHFAAMHEFASFRCRAATASLQEQSGRQLRCAKPPNLWV